MTLRGIGPALRIAGLGTVNALSIWALGRLVSEELWVAAAVLVAATAAIDAVYLVPRSWAIPYRYLVPGTLFLLVFQLYPVLYTASISTTNLGTGNLLDKESAIDQVIATSVGSDPSGPSYRAVPVLAGDGGLALLLEDEATGQVLAGTVDGLEPLGSDVVERDDDQLVGAAGFRALTLGEAADREQELADLVIPADDGVVRLQTFNRAALVSYRLSYDPTTDTMTDTADGTRYHPVDGYFVADDGTRLTPGWQVRVGFDNYRRILDSPAVRGPFLQVFLWNWVFALGAVGLAFALGLALAVTLDHERLRGRRVYRSLLIFPYALPSFLTVLVWQGIMNRQFGILNEVLGLDVPWLTDPWMARASVLLVATWLGFPYFLLVSTGALQAIPGELLEAARVDGASGWKAFRGVTFPLLLVALAPLLVASFAFNFNNFNVIYFLNRGGPPIAGAQTPAGSTDILVSYTYRLALESGRGQDLGFATAISILIFLHVALFSAWGFRRSARLEEI